MIGSRLLFSCPLITHSIDHFSTSCFNSVFYPYVSGITDCYSCTSSAAAFCVWAAAADADSIHFYVLLFSLLKNLAPELCIFLNPTFIGLHTREWQYCDSVWLSSDPEFRAKVRKIRMYIHVSHGTTGKQEERDLNKMMLELEKSCFPLICVAGYMTAVTGILVLSPTDCTLLCYFSRPGAPFLAVLFCLFLEDPLGVNT